MGLILAHSSGEQLVVLTETDPDSDLVLGVSGAVHLMPDGRSFVLTFGEDGLPESAAFEGYVLLFDRFTATGMDVGVVSPDGERWLYRNVAVDQELLQGAYELHRQLSDQELDLGPQLPGLRLRHPPARDLDFMVDLLRFTASWLAVAECMGGNMPSCMGILASLAIALLPGDTRALDLGAGIIISGEIGQGTILNAAAIALEEYREAVHGKRPDMEEIREANRRMEPDYDPCEGKTCPESEDAECSSLSGLCLCNPGFRGDDYPNCTPIMDWNWCDERQTCGPNAHCEPHMGECHCDDGWRGYPNSPEGCDEPMDLCGPEPDCPDNSHCVPATGRCECNEGYWQHGPDEPCTNGEDECEGVQCGPHASCNPFNGICQCDQGYVGSPPARLCHSAFDGQYWGDWEHEDCPDGVYYSGSIDFEVTEGQIVWRTGAEREGTIFPPTPPGTAEMRFPPGDDGRRITGTLTLQPDGSVTAQGMVPGRCTEGEEVVARIDVPWTATKDADY